MFERPPVPSRTFSWSHRRYLSIKDKLNCGPTSDRRPWQLCWPPKRPLQFRRLPLARYELEIVQNVNFQRTGTNTPDRIQKFQESFKTIVEFTFHSFTSLINQFFPCRAKWYRGQELRVKWYGRLRPAQLRLRRRFCRRIVRPSARLRAVGRSCGQSDLASELQPPEQSWERSEGPATVWRPPTARRSASDSVWPRYWLVMKPSDFTVSNLIFQENVFDWMKFRLISM